MTEQQQQLEQRLRQQIRISLVERAAELYPQNTQLQMIYQIGFLQAQLAHAAAEDSKVWQNFIDRVHKR